MLALPRSLIYCCQERRWIQRGASPGFNNVPRTVRYSRPERNAQRGSPFDAHGARRNFRGPTTQYISPSRTPSAILARLFYDRWIAFRRVSSRLQRPYRQGDTNLAHCAYGYPGQRAQASHSSTFGVLTD